MTDLDALFLAQGGVATSGQLLRFYSRSRLDIEIRDGSLIKVWPGVYSRDQPDTMMRLRGLDIRAGGPVAICLGTAAAAYGFDTEDTRDIHALNPPRHQLRNSDGLIVHRRDGAPLGVADGRPATTAAWTAVEVARSLRRPRALATLDAALRSRSCSRRQLTVAAAGQAGRRGIVAVRELIPLADALAESPWRARPAWRCSTADCRRPCFSTRSSTWTGAHGAVDFAWLDAKVAVEYDGFDWHSDAEGFARDRQKRAALNEVNWRMLSVVSDDVRKQPQAMVRRIDGELTRRLAA